MARVTFDGYPVVNDDDLHYFQMNSVVLLPEKTGVTSFAYDVLLLPDENDITAFDIKKVILKTLGGIYTEFHNEHVHQ